MITEISSEGWFGRIGKSIIGVPVGIIIFLVAFPVLFSNEGCAVKKERAFLEAEGAVVSLATDALSGDDGELVHLSGEATADETLRDEEFGIEIQGIRLVRKVEMYQWKENKETRREKKVGGGTKRITEYSYEQGWYSDGIDSSKFKDRNYVNPTLPLSSNTAIASEVHLGTWRLSSGLTNQIKGGNPISVDRTKLPNKWQNRLAENGGGFYLPASHHQAANPPETNVEGDPSSGDPAIGNPQSNPGDPNATGGSNAGDPNQRVENIKLPPPSSGPPLVPNQPMIGDVRISFTELKSATVSVMAQKQGDTLAPFSTKAGVDIEWLVNEKATAAQMIEGQRQAAAAMLWAIRAGGFFMMFVGAFLVLNPFVVFADFIPFVGGIASVVASGVAFMIAAAFASVTIAVAWLFYRPLLALALLALAALIFGGILFLVIKLLKRKKTMAKPA